MANQSQEAIPGSTQASSVQEEPLLPVHRSTRQSVLSPQVVGLVATSVSALFFSCMTALVKAAGSHFPSLEIVFVRSILQLFFGLITCAWLGLNPLGPREHRFKLFLRGVTGSIGLGCFFYAIVHMELGEATVIFFTGPAFTALLAHFWLGESLKLLDIASVLSCLVGVTLVARPSSLFGANSVPESDANPSKFAVRTEDRPLAILAALTGAIMSACAYVLVRRISRGAHYMTHVVYFGIVSTLLSTVLMFATPSRGSLQLPQTWQQCFILIGVGVMAFGGQILLNKGLQLAPAGPSILMRNLDVVFAFIFGVTLFGERPFWSDYVGACLIVGTAIATGIFKVVAERRKQLALLTHEDDYETFDQTPEAPLAHPPRRV